MARLGILAIVVLATAGVQFLWPPAHPPVVSDGLDNVPAHRAIGMLQYVQGDYPEAVSATGEILDVYEFEEQQEVLESVGELLQQAETQSAGNAAPLGEQFLALQDLVRRGAPPDSVQGATKVLRRDIVRHYALRLAPTSLPSLAQGRRLYAEACALCHGDEGRGDNEVAVRLTPRPTDLRQERLRHTLSAYQVYNLVTHGVPGTSMPSFPTLSAAERWAVAFHVLALRHEKQASRHHTPAFEAADGTLGRLPGITLGELAQATDADLHERLVSLGLDAARVPQVLAHLRTTPPDSTIAR